MKRRIAAIMLSALVVLTGCTTYQYGPARVSTFLTRGSIEELEFSTTTNGVHLRVTGYTKDEVTGAEAAARAAAQGAAQGVVAGFTGGLPPKP